MTDKVNEAVVSNSNSTSTNGNSVKTKQHYIVPVLVDITVDGEKNTVFIKPYSNSIGSLLKNGSVDKDTFFKEAKAATVMDMDKPSIYNAYYRMLKDNGNTLNWDEVEAALICGQHLTRRLWIENNMFLRVYKKDNLEQKDALKIYLNGKQHISTGWSPTEEDKQATDWSII